MVEGGGPVASVVPADVQAVGRSAQATAQVLREALSSVARDIDALTTGGWSGAAAKAYQQGWQECYGGGGKILEALETMAEKLGANAAGYQAQEDSNVELLDSSLNIQL